MESISQPVTLTSGMQSSVIEGPFQLPQMQPESPVSLAEIVKTPLPTPFRPNLVEDISIGPHGKLLQQVLEEFPPTYSLIAAYNNWIQDVLPRQIEDKSTMVGNVLVRFGPTMITPPTYSVQNKTKPLTPALCVLNKLTYQCEIRVHITLIEDGSLEDPCAGRVIEQTDAPIAIGKIPCMIKSDLCHLHGKSDSEILAMGSDYRDPGGYFIVNGIERVMFYTEKLRVNRFLTGSDRKTLEKICSITADTIKGTLVTEMRALTLKGSKFKRIIHLTLNVRRETADAKRTYHSMNIFRAIRLYIELKTQEQVIDRAFQDPYVLENLVLSFVKEERRSKIKTILSDTILDALLFPNEYQELKSVFTRGATPAQTDEEINSKILHALESSLLSHIDPRQSVEKIYTACMMTAIISEHVAGLREASDMDSWINKRLATASKWCEQLFRGLWKNFVRERLAPFLRKDNPDKVRIQAITGSIKGDLIDEQFRTSFTSTIWGVGTINVKMRNPVQMLQQPNWMNKISSLNRIDVNIDRKTKNFKVRSIQPDQWGGVCPGETTESDSVGIVKTKAITAQISLPRDWNSVVDILEGRLMITVNGKVKTGGYVTFNKSSPEGINMKEVVLINGVFRGWCNGRETREVLIQARRQGQIDRQTCVILDENGYLIIHTDEGRIVRPLLVVDSDGQMVIQKKKLWHLVEEIPFEWTDRTQVSNSIQTLFFEGCLEWIDLHEQIYCRVAPMPEALQVQKDTIADARRRIDQAVLSGDLASKHKYEFILSTELNNPYTHAEIHPQALYGVSLSLMPFLGFNQAPRVVYQSQMGKQALGTPHINHPNRFDNDLKIMTRATRPLITQQLEKTFGLREFPQGTTLQVAFLNIEGDTQEDAFLINENVVRFGYLNTSHYVIKEVRVSENETLIKPSNPKTGESYDRYQFLTADGLPMIGAPLNTGDYVVGKIKRTGRIGPDGNPIVTNTSAILKHGEYGIVDKVYVGYYVTAKKRELHVKIKIRRDRYHQLGDKLTSRYAQKGTTSRILPAHKLPFVEDTGEVPDMIANTSSTPKRMTMGYLLEPLFGMISAMTGKRYNASPFEKVGLDDTYRLMESMGFDSQGYRWMVNPDTGVRFKAMVFMGPIYIQMLVHFGPEKLQVRSSGIVKQLTHQPPRGTAVGGRRTGEMERDTMIAHGATNVLVERMMTMSDAYKASFCKTCGNFAEVHPMAEKEKLRCGLCKNTAEFVQSTNPYVYKLFVQYMFGAGIFVSFDFKKNTPVVPQMVPEEAQDLEDIIEENSEMVPDIPEEVPAAPEGIAPLEEQYEDDFAGQEETDDWQGSDVEND